MDTRAHGHTTGGETDMEAEIVIHIAEKPIIHKGELTCTGHLSIICLEKWEETVEWILGLALL